MGKIRKLAGDTMWYGLSSILGRLFTFILTPLYTSKYVFSLAEYGIITKLYAYAGFFVILYMYGMETAFFRFTTKNKKEALDYFRLTTSSILITSILFSGTIILMATEIAAYIGFPQGTAIIKWMALIFAIDAIVAIPFAKLRLENQARKFAFIRLGNVVLILLLNIFFLVGCHEIYQGNLLKPLQPLISSFYNPNLKVQYIFIANLIANALMILMLWKEFSQFRLRFNWSMFKPVLIYGLPLTIMGLAGMTNDMLSRAMLEDWLPDGFYQGMTSREAAGVFGACFKLSVFMQLGIQAFRYAAEPFFFSNAEDKDSPGLFSKVLLAFVAFNCVVLVAISLNLNWLSTLVLRSTEYHQGLYIVPILLIGLSFSGHLLQSICLVQSYRSNQIWRDHEFNRCYRHHSAECTIDSSHRLSWFGYCCIFRFFHHGSHQLFDWSKKISNTLSCWTYNRIYHPSCILGLPFL